MLLSSMAPPYHKIQFFCIDVSDIDRLKRNISFDTLKYESIKDHSVNRKDTILMHTLFTFFLIACLSLSCHTQTKDKKPQPETTSKKQKLQHPVPGKSLKTMTAQELAQVIEYAKAIADSDLAFKAFYHIFSALDDHNQLKTYKLDLADYCYGLDSWEKAATRYEEFCLLYPGSEQAEYAQYKLILCTFYLSLNADKDQSSTIKTINLIIHFLKRAKNPKFMSEMESIFKTCRKRLLDHEVVVLETYLKQQKFIGAQTRIDYIKQNFQDISNIEKYIAYLEEMFALVQNPNTRPFTFKLNLDSALEQKITKTPKKSGRQKAVSFFVA